MLYATVNSTSYTSRNQCRKEHAAAARAAEDDPGDNFCARSPSHSADVDVLGGYSKTARMGPDRSPSQVSDRRHASNCRHMLSVYSAESSCWNLRIVPYSCSKLLAPYGREVVLEWVRWGLRTSTDDSCITLTPASSAPLYATT